MRFRAAAAAAAFAAWPVAAAEPLQVVDVLCAGAGAEERAHLAEEVLGATVELEFYRGTRGEGVTRVDVLFDPVDAPIGPFAILTDGPICRLTVPPGDYRVYTWHDGNARPTRARIPGQSRPVRIALGFPEERGEDPYLVPVANDLHPENDPS